MTSFAPVPILDGDPAYKEISGDARVRYVPGSGVVLLQVSSANGDGTYSVATFVLSGSHRDTRQSATQWPSYPAQDSLGTSGGLPGVVPPSIEYADAEPVPVAGR